MFVSMFFAAAGGSLLTLVNWYLAYQMLLNTVIVVYGVLVSIAHINLRRIDEYLQERCNRDSEQVVRLVSGDSAEKELDKPRSHFRFPWIVTPNWLWPLSLSQRHLLDSLTRLYESKITVFKGSKSADAKNIVKVILLNARKDSEVQIVAEGPVRVTPGTGSQDRSLLTLRAKGLLRLCFGQ